MRIRNGFSEIFFCFLFFFGGGGGRSDQSNVDIISYRPGLKTGMDFRVHAGLKTGVKNEFFLV